jgi:regulator of replication initiation timing
MDEPENTLIYISGQIESLHTEVNEIKTALQSLVMEAQMQNRALDAILSTLEQR